MEKMTQIEKYDMIATIVEASEDENKEMLIEFLNEKVAQLENKAAKAKEKAAEKKAEADEIETAVYAAVTEELQTADAITEAVIEAMPDAEITKAKVVNRLGRLVKEGYVAKEQGKTEDKRKVMMYALAPVAEETAE